MKVFVILKKEWQGHHVKFSDESSKYVKYREGEMK